MAAGGHCSWETTAFHWKFPSFYSRHYSFLNPFPLSQSFIHSFLLGEFPPATPPFPHVPSLVSNDHSFTLHVVPFSYPPPKSILISFSLNPSLLHFLLAPSLPLIFSQFLSLFLLRRPSSQFLTLYAHPSCLCNLFLSIHCTEISSFCLCSGILLTSTDLPLTCPLKPHFVLLPFILTYPSILPLCLGTHTQSDFGYGGECNKYANVCVFSRSMSDNIVINNPKNGEES